MQLELLRQFFQADMGAKPVIPEGRLSKPLTSRVVPLHVIDQITDLAPQRRIRRRMPRCLAVEREMRLIRPLQVRFLQKLVEQHLIFLACYDQRRRFIGREFVHRQLPSRRYQRLASEMQ